MGKAARRKEERRIERTLSSQSANDTQTVPAMQQPLVVSYNKLRHAISWADLSTATVETIVVETVPIQPAANDAVIEVPTAPAVKTQKKRGPRPRKAPKEVQQAALWGAYVALWIEMAQEMTPRERRALQRAMSRNSGDLEGMADAFLEDEEKPLSDHSRHYVAVDGEEAEDDELYGFWNDRELTLDDDQDENY